VGGAAGLTAAAMVLRYAPAASAAPACQSPCMSDAAKSFADSNKFNGDLFGGEADRLGGKISALQSKLSHTSGKKARGKIQRQINNLLNQELKVLNLWQDHQSDNYDSYLEDSKNCKSGGNCGDPQKYPDGYTPPQPPPGGQSCANPAAACGELCCVSRTRCCGACKTCCIDEVSCSDCCPK
jgi:hypothetical protein